MHHGLLGLFSYGQKEDCAEASKWPVKWRVMQFDFAVMKWQQEKRAGKPSKARREMRQDAEAKTERQIVFIIIVVQCQVFPVVSELSSCVHWFMHWWSMSRHTFPSSNCYTPIKTQTRSQTTPRARRTAPLYLMRQEVKDDKQVEL